MQGERLRALWHAIERGVAGHVVQAVYPASCAGCGLPGAWFCVDCERSIQEDSLRGCSRCGGGGRRQFGCARCSELFPNRLFALRAGFLLDGPMRRAIHRFKYRGEYERGRDLATRLSARLSSLVPESKRVDTVIPVPLHPRRRRERGFNQAEILADALARTLDVPSIPAVRRVRNTPSQTSRDLAARTENIFGAFAPVNEYQDFVDGKRVVIVDDVTTTGATMAAVAASLEEAGAATIRAIALARER